jgi:hypothetical protein
LNFLLVHWLVYNIEIVPCRLDGKLITLTFGFSIKDMIIVMVYRLTLD